MANLIPRGFGRIVIAAAIGGFWTYVVGPIKVYSNTRMKARFDFQPIPLDEFVPEARFYIGQQIQELTDLGFEPIAYLRNSSTTNVVAYIAMLTNREAGDRAMVSVLYSITPGETKLATRYVEFCTSFSDGSEIDTNNVSTPSAFQYKESRRITRLPGVIDITKLYRIHQYLIVRHAARKPKRIPESGKEIDALQKNIHDSFEDQVANGLLRYDQSTDEYRPTFPGAFRMSYRHLFPFRQLEMEGRKATERELLREVNGLPRSV